MSAAFGVSNGKPAQMAVYTTIEGESTAEIVEKKSRFIAQLAHVETEDEALDFLKEVRTRHIQARHNVYAYILRTQQPASQGQGAGSNGNAAPTGSPKGSAATTAATNRVRYSDDGEPAKTAGMPTLDALQHAGLENVICVTTRYFGGTLLGTGGLVRAYTQAAKAAIEAARIVTISPCAEFTLDIPYSLYDQAVKLVDKAGARIASADFAADVHLVIRMLDGTQVALREKLTELTSGNALVTESDVFYTAW